MLVAATVSSSGFATTQIQTLRQLQGSSSETVTNTTSLGTSPTILLESQPVIVITKTNNFTSTAPPTTVTQTMPPSTVTLHVVEIISTSPSPNTTTTALATATGMCYRDDTNILVECTTLVAATATATATATSTKKSDGNRSAMNLISRIAMYFKNLVPNSHPRGHNMRVGYKLKHNRAGR
jgi:hypothetical protein